MSGWRAALGAFVVLAAMPPPGRAAWEGVDETVVERAAEARGRRAQPLLPQPEGDLQLFLFLLAGAAGGFAAGYAWRGLTRERPREDGP